MDVNDTAASPELQTHLTGMEPALLGDSAAMRALRHEIARIASLDVTVLIEGAIGTGKSVVARAIHQASRRQRGPFVAVDCANLDPATAPSAFFGHHRGAFHGAADDRAGWFEAADRGSLLLARIGELPLVVQPLLLRVVEEPLIHRLGDTASRAVDVRLLVTTDRDLEAEVQASRFREDLFYRLRVVRVQVPRLGSRREDIPLLADAFRRQACFAHGRQVHAISGDAVQHLRSRSWPENVAELRATIEAAVRRSPGTVLEATDLMGP
jgi:two-component system response regulator HydG